MRSRRWIILRRPAALALAYALTLQVLLVAWTAGIPALALANLCTSADAGPQQADHAPVACPCGPLCSAASCCAVAAPGSRIAYVLTGVSVAPAVPRPDGSAVARRRATREPGQPRAPPVLA